MIGFGIILLLMIIVNTYILRELYSISDITQLTLASDVTSIDLAKDIQTYLTDQERHAQKFLVAGDSTYRALMIERSEEVELALDSLGRIPVGPQQALITGALRVRHAWLKNTLLAIPTGSGELSAWQDTVDAMHNNLDDLIHINQRSIDASMERVRTSTAQSANIAFVLTIGTLLAAIIAALIIAHTITKPIWTLEEGTKRIAMGVFDPITVNSHDEIGDLARSVNAMSVALRNVNEMKADMMHTISHELKTPLQAILSAQYLLSDGRAGHVTAEQQRLLAIIKSNIEKLISFSNQFLDLARMEAGKMEYVFEPVDVISILRQTVEDVRPIATPKNLTISMKAEPIPDIFADRARLSTVFSNLLHNAIKYTEAGGSIEVDAGKKGNRVTITIRDTGIGIAGEDLPHIFGKFYRASNAVSARRRGAGIGLALVKAIIEGHNGKVWAESVLGKGSTFHIELPSTVQQTQPRQIAGETHA